MTSKEAVNLRCPFSMQFCLGMDCARWRPLYGIDGKSSPCDMADPKHFKKYQVEIEACQKALDVKSCYQCEFEECPGFFKICKNFVRGETNPEYYLNSLRSQSCNFSACRMCNQAHGYCG